MQEVLSTDAARQNVKMKLQVVDSSREEAAVDEPHHCRR